MIIKVTEENVNELMTYVKKEPSINMFIIGDVEQFGLNNDFLEVYLQYDNNNITSTVLRYYDNVIVYSDNNEFIVEEVMQLIDTFKYERMSGKKPVIERLIPYLTRDKKIEHSYFCQLKKINKLDNPSLKVHQADVNDLHKIIPVLNQVGFYRDNYLESNTRKLKIKAGRLYYIEQDGKVVSTAGTAIETSVSAMIGGVATDIDYRKMGLASLVVSELCKDLLNENKIPCLFFTNPEAGKIYHRIGFVDIDMWTLISFQDNNKMNK